MRPWKRQGFTRQQWFNDTIWRPLKGWRAVDGRWVRVTAPALLLCGAVGVATVAGGGGVSREAHMARLQPHDASSRSPHALGWDEPDPTTTTSTTVPAPQPKPAATGGRATAHHGCGRSLDQIARDENGGSYTGKNPTSTASGKYQVLDSTWGGYGGYQHAQDAPPAVQEAQARELYAMWQSGKIPNPWAASGC